MPITRWISQNDTGPKKTLNCHTLWVLAFGLTLYPSLGQSGAVVCRPVFRLMPACIMWCGCATTRVRTKQNTTNSRNSVQSMLGFSVCASRLVTTPYSSSSTAATLYASTVCLPGCRTPGNIVKQGPSSLSFGQ